MSCVFFYFKKLSLNTEQKFEFLYDLIGGERLLSVVVKPFEILSEVVLHH